MDKVFCLYMTGVYISQIWGIFSTAEKARAAFWRRYDLEKAKPEHDRLNDFDGHHDYHIVELPLDQAIMLNNMAELYKPFPIETLRYDEIKGD